METEETSAQTADRHMREMRTRIHALKVVYASNVELCKDLDRMGDWATAIKVDSFDSGYEEGSETGPFCDGLMTPVQVAKCFLRETAHRHAIERTRQLRAEAKAVDPKSRGPRRTIIARRADGAETIIDILLAGWLHDHHWSITTPEFAAEVAAAIETEMRLHEPVASH